MQLFTTDLKNRPGELAHLCEVMAEHDVNLELSGVTAGDHGFVYFTASDEAAARAALEVAHIGFEEHEALRIKCADHPGEAAAFTRKLADANINIEGIMSVSISEDEVIFAVVVDDPEETRRLLGGQVVG
jgi:hypothetical protein